MEIILGLILWPIFIAFLWLLVTGFLAWKD